MEEGRDEEREIIKNPLNASPSKISNFMVETTFSGIVDKVELVKKFKLDVDFENQDGGLVIKQGDKIVKGPFKLTESTRKIHEKYIYDPIKFTHIDYAQGKSHVIYHKPPEIIPIGCWCVKCKKIGPYGHKLTCTLPNLKSLKLTLGGLIECLYNDKKYRIKLLKIGNTHGEIQNAQQAVSGFLSQVQRLSLKEDDSEQIFISAAIITNIKHRGFL